MSALLERLGVELPVVQAGMGGGISRHELAAAVSEAGGLGTVGLLGASDMRAEVRRARERTGKPVAVNLLLPLARSHPSDGNFPGRRLCWMVLARRSSSSICCLVCSSCSSRAFSSTVDASMANVCSNSRLPPAISAAVMRESM